MRTAGSSRRLRRRLVTVYAAVTQRQPPLVETEAREAIEAPHTSVVFDSSRYTKRVLTKDSH